MTLSNRNSKTLEGIAKDGGASIAASILARVGEFRHRESLLQSWMKHELESVPAQIFWHGLEDEAAPVFVVYKLLHEAFSNSPQFFRRFITDLMSAQPARFSTVFNRETLWSLVARLRGHDVPETWASAASIRSMLDSLNNRSFWRRSDHELDREASSIADALVGDSGINFRNGVEALRRLQVERATGLTHGNLMLFVPAKLNQYAEEVTQLAIRERLPSVREISDKLHEIVRDPLAEGRHQSVRIDLLFTEPEGETMECLLLAREKMKAAELRELRKQSLLVRYFLKYAFTGYDMDKLNVKLAFYLDHGQTFQTDRKSARLFHDEELVPFEDFWEQVTGGPEGAKLVLSARDAAADNLTKSGLMKSIKEHFSRERKGQRLGHA